jgi:hypothetical protein
MTDYALPAARTGAITGLDLRPPAPHPDCDVSDLLDLIATEHPNPALLQVNTGATKSAGGDTPYAAIPGHSRSIPSSSQTPPAPSRSG